jgi:hypothetical protein
LRLVRIAPAPLLTACPFGLGPKPCPYHVYPHLFGRALMNDDLPFTKTLVHHRLSGLWFSVPMCVRDEKEKILRRESVPIEVTLYHKTSASGTLLKAMRIERNRLDRIRLHHIFLLLHTLDAESFPYPVAELVCAYLPFTPLHQSFPTSLPIKQ